MPHTNAATALTSASLNGAPPRGGIAPSACFGLTTPLSIVAAIACQLPSPQLHCALVRFGPTVLPLPSEPWQPLQVPPEASPQKIRDPSTICSRVAPGCRASEATSYAGPATAAIAGAGA